MQLQAGITCKMAGAREGKFSFSTILYYLQKGSYPPELELSKQDKLALRKRSKFFYYKDADLYYIGGQGTSGSKLGHDLAQQVTNLWLPCLPCL